MATSFFSASQRPREWRRKVSISAGVKHGAGWSNGHIVNLSSRGMLLQCVCPPGIGSTIEIRQEGRVISATVVWREGFSAGLSCHGELAIADWLTASADRPKANCSAFLIKAKRRAMPRDHERSRALGRKIEFIAVAAVAALIGISVAAMAAEVLFRPLAAAVAILGR